MKQGFKLYWQTTRTILCQPSLWVILLGCIFFNAIFIVIVPYFWSHTMSNQQMGDQAWEFPLMMNLCCFGLIAFFTSVIGEIVANPNDRLFVLTRQVTRFTYLTVKILISLCFCFVICSLMIIFYWTSNKILPVTVVNTIKEQGLDATLKDKITALFIWCSCGATYSVCFRFYIREMLISIIILIVFFAYAVAFYFINPENIPEANAKAREHFMHLEYFTIPLSVVLPLNIIGIIGGYLLNQRVNIGS